MLGLLSLTIFATRHGSFSQYSVLVRIIGVFTLGTWLFNIYIIEPLLEVSVFLSGDRIEISTSNIKKTIQFSDISKVEVHYWPFLGGWYYLCLSSGEKVKVSIMLERSSYILDALLSYKPELVKKEDVQIFRRTAIFADHSWTRFQNTFSNVKILLVKYFVIPSLLAFSYEAYSYKPFCISIYVHLFF